MAAYYREIIDGNEDASGLDAATVIKKMVEAEMTNRANNKGNKLIHAARLWYPYANF
jgi:hypothetical protein